MAALPTKLYTLHVYNDSNDRPLILHFTSEKRKLDTAFELKRAGFKVAGEYLGAYQLNNTPAEAMETARVHFRRDFF